MSEALISPPMLFRFAGPCVYTDVRWSAGGIKLEERHRLTCFAELSGKKRFADIRLAWKEQGIAVNVTVRGKQQPPRCRDPLIDDIDGLPLMFDSSITETTDRACT